jgi:hypothetical protein
MNVPAQKTRRADGRTVALPIGFVKYYDKGSTRLAGEQIATALTAERGVEASVLHARRLARLRRPSILVFIKTSRLDHLLLARLRGHRLVLDVQDTVVFKRHIKNRWLYHALIFKNHRQVADFARPRSLDRIIPHHWDRRYRPHQAPPDELRVGYFGEPRSFPLWGELPGVSCHADDWFTAALAVNCHLSIRRPGREALYKPNCKVSTAAACGANLITTRDVSVLEMLGEDYPFYCEPTRESVLAAIEHARRSLGGPLWELGLERMRRVRELTNLDRVLDDYQALFAALGASAPRRATASRVAG